MIYIGHAYLCNLSCIDCEANQQTPKNKGRKSMTVFSFFHPFLIRFQVILVNQMGFVNSFVETERHHKIADSRKIFMNRRIMMICSERRKYEKRIKPVRLLMRCFNKSFRYISHIKTFLMKRCQSFNSALDKILSIVKKKIKTNATKIAAIKNTGFNKLSELTTKPGMTCSNKMQSVIKTMIESFFMSKLQLNLYGKTLHDKLSTIKSSVLLNTGICTGDFK